MKGKKRGLKLVARLVGLVCVTAAVELALLNLGQWKLLSDSAMVKDRVYTLADCEKANWDSSGEYPRSYQDPILVFPHIDCYVQKIVIQAELSPAVPYIDLFYTNEDHLQYGDMILRADGPGQEETIEIGDRVSDLRVDLGDDPGTELRHFTMVINPVHIQFSVPILVAVSLMYLLACFLFSLQKTPDYGLDRADIPRRDTRQEDEV